MPSAFGRFRSFNHDDLTAKHCYFGYSRPPDVNGIKVFAKDDQATKHEQLFVACSILSKT